MKRLLYSLLFISSIGQAQELVKDINKNPATQPGYENRTCFVCGGKIYTVARDGAHGQELWVTDGTEQGTRLVVDAVSGQGDGVYGTDPVCNDNKLYFGNKALWRTDGTDEGTVEVFPYPLITYAVLGNKILVTDYENIIYTANDDGSNLNILKQLSDGDHGTPGINWITATSTHIYIIIAYSNGGNQYSATELWAYNGTSLELIKETDEEQNMSWPIALGNKLVFNVTGFSSGFSDSWVSDGTAEGTKLLKQDVVVPGLSQYNQIVDEKLLLNSSYPDEETWLTDGTPEGTTRTLANWKAQNVIREGDDVYFTVRSTDDYQPLIIKTDTDFENDVLLTPNSSQDNQLLGSVNGKFLIASESTDHGYELLSVDGTTTALVKDIYPGTPGSRPRSFASLGNMGIFLADDGEHGVEFWRTDGTEAGTSFVKDIATGTLGTGTSTAHFYNGKLYFAANSDTLGIKVQSLWASDGTASGTTLINHSTSDYNQLMGVGKYVITSGSNAFNKIDVTTGELSVLANTNSGGGGGLVYFRTQAVGDDLYFYRSFVFNGFYTGYELSRVNPVTNEFEVPKDIYPGETSSVVDYDVNGAALNNKLVFAADSPDGIEPWITDGTPEGTIQLKDIDDGTDAEEDDNDSYPAGFITLGDKVYFVAASPLRRQLWVTNGTPNGTQFVKEPGEMGGVISDNLGVVNNKILFGWTPGNDGSTQLWISDGTSGGTQLLREMPEVKNTTLSDFTNIGDKTIFVAEYKTLWVTDGTVEGTKKLDYDVDESLFLRSVVVSNGAMYFYNEGRIWRTFGESVELVGPANLSIIGVSNNTDFYVNDNYVMFFQQDPIVGVELFRYDLSKITGLDFEDQKEQATIVYPNPTQNTLFVKSKSPATLRIIDMSGRERHNQFIGGDTSVDVSSYADDMYVVILNDQKVKFIKRH